MDIRTYRGGNADCVHAVTIFLAHNGYNVNPQFHASNEWLKYEFEINKPISL